jgi:hypothetical protein
MGGRKSMKKIFLALCFCLLFSWNLNATAELFPSTGEVETVAANPLQTDMQARHHHRKAHPAKRHRAHRAGVQ